MTANRHVAVLSPRALGDLNASRVLMALADHGPLSRSDLARLSGVGRGSMSKIAQHLLDDGLLEELPPVESGSIGKPARPLWFADRAGLAAALALSGAAVEAALVDARGTVHSRARIEIRDAGSARAVERATVAAASKVMAAGAPVGIGVSVPGTCGRDLRTVLDSIHVPGAIGSSITDALERETGCAVYVDNDAHALAAADRWFGRGRGVASYASLQTGAGLGAGLVLDGVLVRGPRGATGEIGHTCVDVDGARCECGFRGCWETLATTTWLRASAAQAGLPSPRSATAASIAKRAATGDERAAALLERYAEHLALGIANLNQTLDPGLFILHGDAEGGGERFRRSVEEAARRRARGPLDVVFSSLGDMGPVLGAAALVLAETFRLVA